LLAVRYFVDRFKDAPWGFYVFITDGELFDLEEVKRYSTQLAREVSAGRRKPLKFVLIGVGPEVNEPQMEELDDLDTGTEVDLWDHKLAAHMHSLLEIFAEVVDKNARVSDQGKIVDPQGRVLKNYSDTGLPAFLEFEAPTGAGYFTLEVDGNRIHQPLYDQAQVPAAVLRPAAAPPPPAARAARPAAPPAARPAVRPIPPTPPAKPAEPELVEDAEKVAGSSDDDELWKSIDLRPAREGEQDVDL